MGPDSKPLVTQGTVDIIFTLDGHAFQHEFIVVRGGDLLLLDNDFLARYNPPSHHSASKMGMAPWS